MDTSPKETAAHNHKRFPSSVDSAGVKKELKNFCLDRVSRKMPTNEVSPEKTVFAKKTAVIGSGTSDSDKLQKRSLDESRLSQSVRNLSDKSFALPAPVHQQSKSSIQATPALLAELLKGSSEKLLSEQLQGSGRGKIASHVLPTAVLKCLVNILFNVVCF